jgi:hypothetical protein
MSDIIVPLHAAAAAKAHAAHAALNGTPIFVFFINANPAAVTAIIDKKPAIINVRSFGLKLFDMLKTSAPKAMSHGTNGSNRYRVLSLFVTENNITKKLVVPPAITKLPHRKKRNVIVMNMGKKLSANMA